MFGAFCEKSKSVLEEALHYFERTRMLHKKGRLAAGLGKGYFFIHFYSSLAMGVLISPDVLSAVDDIGRPTRRRNNLT